MYLQEELPNCLGSGLEHSCRLLSHTNKSLACWFIVGYIF